MRVRSFFEVPGHADRLQAHYLSGDEMTSTKEDEMHGGLKRRLGACALALGFVTVATWSSSVQAADLGGDCCADLEERIAELEATTARKGNRKVSLSISGWVSHQIYAFDDGLEKNVYVTDKATDLASHVVFSGSAQIAEGWKTGYTMAIYADPGDSLLTSQDDDNAGVGLTVENSYWWLESDRLGKFSMGLQSGTGDNWAIFTDFTGTLYQANTVAFDGPFMKLRLDGATGSGYGVGLGATWQSFMWCETIGFGIAGDCAGTRNNSVRYDTPTFGGFAGSASWGEDDTWSVGGKYAGEFGGFKLSAAAAFTSNTDNAGALGIAIVDTEYTQVGLTVKHLPTSLWFHGIYGHEETDTNGVPDGNHYYLKAGWSPKLNPLGLSHIYGEFGQNFDMFGNLAETTHAGETCASFGGVAGTNIATACGIDATTAIVDSKLTRIGVGLVQDIDAAAMSVWANWRMHELDADFSNSTGTVQGKQDFKDLQMFLAGALISF